MLRAQIEAEKILARTSVSLVSRIQPKHIYGINFGCNSARNLDFMWSHFGGKGGWAFNKLSSKRWQRENFYITGNIRSNT